MGFAAGDAMTITLQLRSGDVVHEVRAGVAEQRALYLDGTLLELGAKA